MNIVNIQSSAPRKGINLDHVEIWGNNLEILINLSLSLY